MEPAGPQTTKWLLTSHDPASSYKAWFQVREVISAWEVLSLEIDTAQQGRWCSAGGWKAIGMLPLSSSLP